MTEAPSGYDRINLEKYFTPAWVIDALLDAESFANVWEPAAGAGNMFNDTVQGVTFDASGIEYNLFNLNERKYSPYVFGGLAVYHFNPYAFNGTDEKIYLKPLSTEGQGLPGYSAKPYSLTQLAIPFGGGMKYAINDKFRLGLELGIRKLFTDYLDDVSGFYADQNDLLANRGQLAVDMSYRADEVAGGNPSYPTKGTGRGGPENNDIYYFLGLHLTYRLGGGKIGRSYSCPVIP